MHPVPGIATPRSRPDRCPGIVHPWPAADGGLVRIRVPGGQLRLTALRGLLRVAEAYGDGRVRLTSRANLQVRGLPMDGTDLAPTVLEAIEATGVLPSRRSDRIRNVLASPQTGLAGGRADLRPLLTDLDGLLTHDRSLAGLPGRFLFTVDDGRGDLADRHRDLGLVAVDAERGQLRIGAAHGPVVRLSRAADDLADLARTFLTARGTGPAAAWHVDELAAPLRPPVPAHPEALVRTPPLPFGDVPGGHHIPVDDDGITAHVIADWTTETVVLTPWHGVLIPEETR